MLSAGALETVAWFDSASAADAGADGGAPGAWDIAAFADDVTLPLDDAGMGPPDGGIPVGSFAVRFINAAPNVPRLPIFGSEISLGGSALGPMSAMFFDVPYQAAGRPSSRVATIVDGNGFLLAPSSGATPGFAFVAYDIAPGAVAGALQVVQFAVGHTNVAAGAVLTVVLLPSSGSDLSSSDGGTGEVSPFQFLQCVDNAGTLEVSGPCSLLSP
jgi:hypothetical protein